jgi:hypothetical protein
MGEFQKRKGDTSLRKESASQLLLGRIITSWTFSLPKYCCTIRCSEPL